MDGKRTPSRVGPAVAIFQTPLAPMRYHHLNGVHDVLQDRFVALLYGRREELQIQAAAARFHYRFATAVCIELRRRGSHYQTRAIYFPPALVFHLLTSRPQAVLTSGMSVPSLLALGYCLMFRRRLIIHSEGTSFTERSITRPQRFLRRVFTKFADGFLVVGAQSKQYIESLGVPPERICVAPQTTDVRLFGELAARLRRTNRRSPLQPPRLVYAGRLVPRKGVHLLLDAFRQLLERRPGAELWIVGDGVARPSLEEQAASSGIGTSVRFLGQISNECLPEIFALCDVFLLPSLEDTYAVVIPEAMAAGLPVVCSRHVGAVDDLVVPGVTGFVADFTNTEEVVGAVEACLARASELGAAARDLVEGWDISTTIQRTLLALGL
jgi:glycosyltransferase involved in cell wall biosynthesis